MSTRSVYLPPDHKMTVQKVDLPEGIKKKVCRKLLEAIKRAERDRAPLEESWRIGVLQYHSRLIQDEQAGTEESVLDMPLTEENCQQAAARLVNPIIQQDPMLVSKARKPQYKDIAREYEDLMDYLVDRSDSLEFLCAAVKYFMVFSKVVVRVPYVRKERKIRRWQKVQKEIRSEDGTIVLDYEDVTEEISETVVDWEGAQPEVIHTPDFIHPFPCRDIDSAAWVAERIWLDSGDMRYYIRKEVYDKPEDLGEPTERPDSQLTLSVEDKAMDEESADQKGLFKVYDAKTTPGAWLTDEECEKYDLDPEDEIVVTVDGKDGFCLRMVYNWLQDYPRDYFTYSYDPVLNDIDGVSLAHKLEPMHRAVSGSVNQRLDTASKANKVFGVGSTNGELKNKMRKNEITGGYTELSSPEAANSVRFQNISQPYHQMEGLEQMFMQHANKIAGHSDYTFGMEQISRPTASGQVSLIQEGQQPLFLNLERFRKFVSLVYSVMVSRYAQFQPDGVKIYMEDAPKGDPQYKQFTWPDGKYWQDLVAFETKVSSQKMNKMLRRQEILGWLDKAPQIFETYANLIQASAEGTPMSAAMEQLLNWYVSIITEALDEFDMGGSEFADVGEALNVGRIYQQAIQQRDQAIAMLQQQLAAVQGVPPGPGGGPRPPGGPQRGPGMGGGPQMGPSPVPSGPAGPPVG